MRWIQTHIWKRERERGKKKKKGDFGIHEDTSSKKDARRMFFFKPFSLLSPFYFMFAFICVCHFLAS